MRDKGKKRESRATVAPICEVRSEMEDSNCMIMEERNHQLPLHRRVQDAAKNAWSGQNVAITIGDILGPHARKEWNLPVGSHKNPFWRLTKRMASPNDVKKMLSKSLMLSCTMGSAALVKNLLEAGADPNSESGKWGPLHSAAYGGNAEVMRVLLEDPRTLVDCMESKGKTALHLAAKKGNYEVLKVLLETTKVDVNAADVHGSTALHVAGSSPLLGEVSTERIIQCISLLMNRPELKLNKPDKDGLTALGQTVMFSRKDITQAMLKHNRGQYFNIDTFLAGYYNRTIRDAITDSYPELTPDLPCYLQEKLDSSDTAVRLLAALQKGDFKSFQLQLKNQKRVLSLNHWFDEPYHCTIIEIACQMKNRLEFISELLKAGANPNAVNPVTSQSLLHITAKSGNVDALRMLLQVKDINVNIKDAYERTPLHCLSRIHCRTEDDSQNLQESINLLIGEGLEQKADVNSVTCNGETPLHIAARMGEKETIVTLLKNGANIMYRTVGTDIQPPLTYIDPTVLESYLDECIESNEESSMNEDYMLTIDYNFLSPSNVDNEDNNKKKKHKRDPEMPTLKYMSIKDSFKPLLKHPVLSSFIELKWDKVWYLFAVNFLLYSLFLGVLTWYSVLDESERNENTTQSKIALSLLSLLLSVIILAEAYQFLVCPKTYVLHSPNYLLWIVILATLNVCVDTVVIIIPQCTSIALMLAWTQFVMLIGSFPTYSIQLEMLKTVAWTFFTFIICYCPLFFAFAICFYTMFRHSNSKDVISQDNNSTDENFFSMSFGMSLLKIFIMFAGEFEAGEIPFDDAPYTSHIVFIIFVFLIAIVLLNLLNGLAVSDAQAIRRDAEILSLSARVKSLYYIEKMSNNRFAFFSVLESLPDKKLRIFPNRKHGRVEVNGVTYQNRKLNQDTIQEAVNLVNKTEERKSSIHSSASSGRKSQLQEKVADVERQQKDMSRKINDITKQLELLNVMSRDSNTKINEILNALGSHSSIR